MGHSVVVFEADHEIGGRASTLRDGGFTLDTGASLLLSNYRRTISLVRTLGGDEEIVRYRGRSGFHDGDRIHVLRLESRRSYLRLDLLPTRDKLRFARRGLRLAMKGGPDMFDLSELGQADDGETTATWARQTFGDAGYEYVVRPSIEGMTGFSCEEVSAATGKALLNAGGWRGLSFYAIRPGTCALCEWLLVGSDCRLGCPVESVSSASGEVVVRSGAGSETFAGAIVATDARTAAQLIQPGAAEKALSRVRYAANVHVALAYEEDPWPRAPVDAVSRLGPANPRRGRRHCSPASPPASFRRALRWRASTSATRWQGALARTSMPWSVPERRLRSSSGRLRGLCLSACIEGPELCRSRSPAASHVSRRRASWYRGV